MLLPIFASLGVGILAVSSDSFWIDEGLSAIRAVTPSLGEAWQDLRAEASTNMHMLLYMSALWGWEKCFGSSEWALRSMNIPFFVLGVTALWSAVPRASRPFVLVFCLVSPFLWFYLNEARTYSMIFGFSAVATAAVLDWLDHGEDRLFTWTRWGWILSLSMVALTWTHVVGLVFELAVAILVFTRTGWRGLQELLRKVWAPIMFLAVANLALVGYLLWTKTQGVEANPIGKTTWVGFVYWLYEFGGFAGLGPNRNDLRIHPYASLGPHFLALSLLGLAWLAVLLSRWKSVLFFFRRRPEADLAICLVIVPILIFLVAGVWLGARFLTRYAASSYPAFAVLISGLLCACWAAGGWRRAACLFLITILAISSLLLRFSPLHAKDDYRGVASWLQQKKIPQGRIWWTADPSTARYYGLDQVTWAFFMTPVSLAVLPAPECVVLSKPDIYDQHFAVRKFLENSRAQRAASFSSFEVYVPTSR